METAVIYCIYNGTMETPQWVINNTEYQDNMLPARHQLVKIEDGYSLHINASIELNYTKYQCRFYNDPSVTSNSGYLHVQLQSE